MKKFTLTYIFLMWVAIGSTYAQNLRTHFINHQSSSTESYNCSKLSHFMDRGGIVENSNDASFTSKNQEDCETRTYAQWIALSNSAFISEMKKIPDIRCGESNFQNSVDSNLAATLFSNARIGLVADELERISSSYDGTMASGALGLIGFLRSAAFVRFGESSVDFSSDASSNYARGVRALAASPNIRIQNKEVYAYNVLRVLITASDETGVRVLPEVTRLIENVLRDFDENELWKPLQSESNALNIAYANTFNSIAFYLSRGRNQDSDFRAYIANNNFMLKKLVNIIKPSNITLGSAYANFINNYVLEISGFYANDETFPAVRDAYRDLINRFPTTSPNWFRLMRPVADRNIECGIYGACAYDKLLSEQRKRLMPNKFIFDNGKRVIETALSYEDALRYYYATKQVESQLFRVLKTDQEAPGEDDDLIRMIIYGSRDDYRNWNPLFHTSFGRNAGGVYIEQNKNFYTFDRTPTERNPLTLEELVRHEYVHFLLSQYVIPGNFGQTDFFKNQRLTFFDEGLAEYFAGSTANDGVRIRKNMATRYISSRNQGNAFDIKKIVKIAYSDGQALYQNSNAFWHFINERDVSIVRRLVNYIKTDDISGFDTEINRLGNDTGLQEDYETFIDARYLDENIWWEKPITQYPEDANNLTFESASEVDAAFESITGITNATTTTEYDSSIKRFKITGTTNVINNNPDQTLDAILKTLIDSNRASNFDYINGYYTNISGLTMTFIINGSLKGGNFIETCTGDDKPQVIALVNNETTNGANDGKITLNYKLAPAREVMQISIDGGNTYPYKSKGGNPSINIEGLAPGTYEIWARWDLLDCATLVNAITIGTGIPSEGGYCASGYERVNSISKVKFGSIEFNSGKSAYSDFTELSTDVIKGSTIPMTIELALTAANRDRSYIKAWIDWNQDGDFNDGNEEVLTRPDGLGATTQNIRIPTTAKSGKTRLRVRYNFSSDPKPCGTDRDDGGDTEDYSIIVTTDTEICSGTDLPVGTLSSTNETSVNADDGSITISYDNAPSRSRIEFSIDNGNTYNFDAADNTGSFTINDLDAGVYGVWARWENGECPTSFGDITVATDSSSDRYCSSGYDGVNEIYKVVFAGIDNNSSSARNQSYTFFENQTATVIQGKSFPIAIDLRNETSNWTSNNIIVWIDWNRDGDFEDAGEEVFVKTSSIGGGTGTISVPSNASLGKTRMRIRYNWFSPPKPCGTGQRDGDEVEDYTVNIIENDVTPPVDITYCEAGFTRVNSINRVIFGDVDNSSGKDAYSDFTSSIAFVNKTTATRLTITPKILDRGEHIFAWIDWNKDGDFDDAEELVVSHENRSGSATVEITAPSDAIIGTTRMRIRMNPGSNSLPKPCGMARRDGADVEDYTVSISADKVVNPTAKTDITVYPNPFKNQVTIDLTSLNGAASIITLSDVTGKIIKKFVAKKGTPNMILGTSDIVNGMYLVRIRNKDKVITAKLVKE